MSGNAAQSPPSYAWLLDLLMADSPVHTWAPAGELPGGFKIAEQFAVLPGSPGRHLLISLQARRGAAAVLTSYNALRSPRRRLARRVLGAGLRAGLAQPLLPRKIDVGRAVTAAPGNPASLLTEHLCQLFGRAQVVVAVSGGDGPYRKPVLQVFSTDGAPLGFVKVGWNAWTREAIRREAVALRACAQRGPALFGAPALRDHYSWRGLDFLVTAPLPPGIRPLATTPRLPDVRVLREISNLSELHDGDLASSPWWIGLRARIAAVGDAAAREELDEAADRVERSDAETTLEFGQWHGDLVPWNLGRLGQRVLAWDWEDSSPAAPVGFDALHFYFQVAFVQRHLPLEEAAHAALKAGPALEALGVPATAHRLIAILHLLELFTRHAEARSSTGTADERFYPAVVPVLHRAFLKHGESRHSLGRSR